MSSIEIKQRIVLSGAAGSRMILALLLIISSDLIVSGQDGNKFNTKTPDELVSIAYQDLCGKSLNSSEETTRERSIQAIGDKTLGKDNVINGMIYYQTSASSLGLPFDSAAFDKFKDCPHISAYRPADPLLMVIGVVTYRITTGEPNFFKACQNYNAWQKQNAEHSPFGNNDNDKLSGTESEKWLLSYTLDWLSSYPQEYNTMLHQFDSCYGVWKMQNNGNYVDFIRYNSAKAGHGIDEEVDQILSIGPGGTISTISALSLPTEEVMRNDTRNFINDVYENLYMRTPTSLEMDFLQKYIGSHKSLTVQQFYYAMMTGEEYNYY